MSSTSNSHGVETIFIRVALSDEKNAVQSLILNHLAKSAGVTRSDPSDDSWLHSKPGAASYVEFHQTIVALAEKTQQVIGAAQVYSLAGLPLSEGLAEVKNLVIGEQYRQRGIGRQLLAATIEYACQAGFNRIYLKTSPDMEVAQRLFHQFGFKPVIDQKAQERLNEDEAFPCYFVLENLNAYASKLNEVRRDSPDSMDAN